MRALPLVGLLALLVALSAPLASGHAVLQSATPAPNGHADEGVAVIELRFTENVEREYTGADVIDVQGESRAAGPVEFDADARNVIRLPVGPLESGIYSVSWQTLSVDTHTARGSFLFSVGNATLRYTPAPPAHDHSEHTAGSVLRDGAARGVFYAGLFLVGGMPLFGLVVARGDLPRRLLGTAAAFGAVGAAAGGVMLLLLADRTSLPPATALRTAAGTAIAWRALLLGAGALALAAALAPRAEGARRRALAWAAVALAAGAVAATSLGSHAAALQEGRTVAVLADAAHLAMAAVWVGGVVAFLLLAWGRGAQRAGELVARFSPLAVASVGLILLTGAYASVRHIPCLPERSCTLGGLAEEPYALLVGLKLLLLAPLVAIGAYNKASLGPRLERGDASPLLLRRVLQGEAVLMALVVSAAGILAASPPPDADVQEGEQGGDVLEFEETTQKSHVILQVRPNPPAVGIQRLSVVVHPLGPTLPNATQVALKLEPPGQPEPETLVPLEKVTPNEWSGEDAYFTEAGTWTVHVIVQRPDEYVKLQFSVEVVAPGSPPPQGENGDTSSGG